MDPKQIELQVAANQKEGLNIQNQLLQMDISNPQRQPLVSRLEMINRSQSYWTNEYFRLTGQHLSVPPIKISLKTNPSFPPPVSTPSEPTDWSTAKGLVEWKAMRLKISSSLTGNPNSFKVESYLDTLEKIAGRGVPKIPESTIFGKVRLGSSGLAAEDLMATPLRVGSYSFENSEAIVLMESGQAWTPVKDTLLVVYPNRHQENGTLPKVEIKGTDFGEAVKALQGE